MIIAGMSDRLGNQMFQYAAAKGLAARKKTGVRLDKRYYNHNAPQGYFYGLDAFNITEDFATPAEIREYTGLSDSLLHKAIRKLYKAHQARNINCIYQERFFNYDDEINNLGNKVYLRGYWQSYKYFNGAEKEIRSAFTFKLPINKQDDTFAQDICNSNSVCLSFRRGDHLWHPITSQKYGHCGLDYYLNGLSIIAEKQKDLKLFIFSDDIDWCEQNLTFNYPTVFVKHKFRTPGFAYYLQLISLCKHFIIPVSTFPWWGAWLSANPDKMVIAPKIWFTDTSINTSDLFPDNWIKI